MTRRPPRSTLFPYPPLSRSLRPRDHDALPDQHLRVPPADPGEVEVALVIHVRHLEPDLVDVAGEHKARRAFGDRKSTRLNSSHLVISYAVFCLKKKKK